VLETSLTDQLTGAFSPRLRHVEITGSELRSIDSEAFEGIEENHELVLQIRGTQIEELPAGLFAKLEKIPHLSLDLRDNKFSSLSPGTLYSNGTSWENIGTRLISGKWHLYNTFHYIATLRVVDIKYFVSIAIEKKLFLHRFVLSKYLTN
jgi:hypothetical protein